MQQNTPYILFLTFVLLVTVSFFCLIKDFLLACFWAIILAVVFDPVYQRFSSTLSDYLPYTEGRTSRIISYCFIKVKYDNDVKTPEPRLFMLFKDYQKRLTRI